MTGGSFTDRSFLFATAVSVLWHLFWFFSVTIVVTPHSEKKPSHTKFVSIGPVLDDSIFQTLVESRPEYSKAFYRELSDFDAVTELPAPEAERYESGDVTSLPVDERSARSLRRLISSDYFQLSGDAAAQEVLSRPEPPDVNDVRAVELDFELDSAGKVVFMAVVTSSGDSALDQRWEDHLRQWLFAPAPSLGMEGRVKGRAVFRRTSVSDRV